MRFHEDNTNFVTNIIRKGYARKVPGTKLNQNDGKEWYLLHHRVYCPKKPDKIRVVYNCSVEYQGASLNKQLYQGSDLTNILVGVLTRFCQEKVAFMTDVEAMFHQVQVLESDCDLLRFFWWPEGDVDQKIQEYQMTVRLFGDASLSSCANFALRRTTEDNNASYDPTVIDTV